MKDFPGFCVLLRYLLGCMRSRQILQDAFCDARRYPQTLERSNDSIAAKNGVEPRHTGVWVRTFRIAFNQHPQIRGRARQPCIKGFAGRRDSALVDAGTVKIALQSPESCVEGI